MRNILYLRTTANEKGFKKNQFLAEQSIQSEIKATQSSHYFMFVPSFYRLASYHHSKIIAVTKFVF